MLSRQAELECTVEVLSVEIQKLQVLLDDLTQDYVAPLRGAVERREMDKVQYLTFCESSRADVLCSLCSDVLDNMRGYIGEALKIDSTGASETHKDEIQYGFCAAGQC